MIDRDNSVYPDGHWFQDPLDASDALVTVPGGVGETTSPTSRNKIACVLNSPSPPNVLCQLVW